LAQNSDYLMHMYKPRSIWVTSQLSLATFIGMCLGALRKPIQSQMVVQASMSIGGTIIKVEELP